MKYKIRELIDKVDLDDLQKMKKDISNGGFHITNLIDNEIKTQENKHKKTCSTCSINIDQYSTNNYTLIFGPSDFSKKATFCGIDCMEYFLNNIKKVKCEVENAKKN